MFTSIKHHQPVMEGYKRTSSILVPLVQREHEWYVLFTKRALTLRYQPGDICFPGGRIEEGESAKEACIREVMEELGVCREQIEVLGQVDTIITPFRACVYPFVGILKIDEETCHVNKDEVDQLLYIPLSYFLKEEPMQYQIGLQQVFPDDYPFELVNNGKDYQWPKAYHMQYFYHYLGNTIWGLTARIMHNVITILKEEGEVDCEH